MSSDLGTAPSAVASGRLGKSFEGPAFIGPAHGMGPRRSRAGLALEGSGLEARPRGQRTPAHGLLAKPCGPSPRRLETLALARPGSIGTQASR